MTLVPGSRLGPYEITAPLGEGGMGVVYRATDSKLKREVAIKVLPEAFAADADRLARFEREAQVLAQLQHPNVASIYGLEESSGVRALVMELVEGEDLSERLKRGPVPLDEALAIARQVAEALEAAHEKGIVHRDLKPANVKLTPDGKVKVLDFGLAKAMDAPAGGASATDLARSPTLMNSPTMTAAHGTQLGVILGTAGDMSPEQARGGTVDKRADIWAFGVVLFEMLTARRLLAGDTVSDTLAAVLRQEVDWGALPAAAPAALRRLLRLWVRPLDAVSPRRLEGVEDATYPFCSPDGAWIGFFAGGQVRKVPREGGAAQELCDATEGRGASWGPGGVIVFSPNQGGRGLWRVSDQGGPPVPLKNLPSPGVAQYLRYPQFLPDGRSFLFQHLAAAPEIAGVWVGTLDGGAPERVLEGGDKAVYAPAKTEAGSGYLLYRREQTLLAQPFAPERRRTAGEASPVADGVGDGLNTGAGAFSVSSTGVLAFSADWERSGEMVWTDRAGQRVGVVNRETREVNGLSLSRGGQRLAFGAGILSDIWVQALPDGEPSRFTFGPAPGWAYPVWSPDGSELAYTTSDLAGMKQYEIRRRRADRAGAEETLLATRTVLYPWDWLHDGRSLVYGDEAGDLFVLPLTGERTPVPFLSAPGKQAYAQFSPDGSLFACASDEQGSFEVFVGTVPPSGAIWQISTGAGTMPRWRRDGRELSYRAADGNLMVVALGGGGPGAAAIDGRSAPMPLFPGIPSAGNTLAFMYSPADDGQRFLVCSSKSTDQPPITVVVNWQAALGSAGAR